MRDFKNSLLADEDLVGSFEYGLEEWGYEQALKYKEELEKGRDKIRNDPFLVNSKSREELAEGCRSYRVNNYYYFYKVSNDDSSILIARVLHERMNFPDHIRKEYFPE